MGRHTKQPAPPAISNPPNPAISDELLALQAIYGDDLTREIRTVKQPWKQPVSIAHYTLQLHHGDIRLNLEFEFSADYPASPPLLWLKGTSADFGPILQKAKETAQMHIGAEMMFEIFSCVQDCLADFSAENRVSAYDSMKDNERLNEQETKRQERHLQVQEQVTQRQATHLLKERVEKEIQDKMRKLVVAPPLDHARFKEIQTCPVPDTGCESLYMGWLPGNKESYLVYRCALGVSEETTIENVQHSLDAIQSICELPAVGKILDAKATQSRGQINVQIVFENRNHISLTHTMKISSPLNLDKTLLYLADILAVGDELSRRGLVFPARPDLIFFRGDGALELRVLVIDLMLAIFRPAVQYALIPWVMPDIPVLTANLWSIAAVFMYMCAPKITTFKSPADCAASFSQPDLAWLLKKFVSTDPANPLTIKSAISKLAAIDLKKSPREAPASPQLPVTKVERLKNSSRYHTDFSEIGYIGRGGFGAVVKAKNLIDGRVYAIKVIKVKVSDSSEKTDRLLREVQTLSRLQSNHVVRYYQAWFEDCAPGEMDFLEDSSDDDYESSLDGSVADTSDWLSSSGNLIGRVSKITSPTVDLQSASSPREVRLLYIQMEYCENKTLAHVIESGVDVETCWRLFRQMLEGLGHLHSQGIIHRDLKPSNIFLDEDDHVKIGDFGLATATSRRPEIQQLLSIPDHIFAKSNSLTSEIGTPFYIAPEVVNKLGKYNTKVDMYSLGICFFEMVYMMKTLMQKANVLRQLRTSAVEFPAGNFSLNKILILSIWATRQR